MMMTDVRVIVTGARDDDAALADGEELRPLTNDSDRKQVCPLL